MGKLEQLRIAIRNESLPLAERKAAAEHLVTALVDAVPEPGADEPEVLELVKPWPDDGPLGSIAPMAWRARNEHNGWHTSGPSLAQARKHLHKRLKLRALLAVVVNEAAHRLERLAACERVSEDHRPEGGARDIRRTPDEMLASIKPTIAIKRIAGPNGFPEQVRIARPPAEVSDVW